MFRRIAMFVFAAFMSARLVSAAELPPLSSLIHTAKVDAQVGAEWVAGAEKALDPASKPIVYTTKSVPDWQGVKFGVGSEPGPRHLRVGFVEPLAVGAVLVRGGGTFSVLKPTAKYPGDLADETQWLPAARFDVTHSAVTTNAPVGREGYALWTLPTGTSTRAIRFTHLAESTDTSYEGWLGGAFLLTERVANVAPFATVTTWKNQPKAQLIVNESHDKTWGAWESHDSHEAVPESDPLISSKDPGLIVLTWNQPVALRGLCALWAGFGAADVQEFVGASEAHPRSAPEADWKTIATFDKVSPQYPHALGPNWLDFGKEVKTRAIRLRVTKVMTSGHPHVQNNAKGGKRIWLGELMALASVGDQPLAKMIPAATAPAPQPPIPIQFTMPEPGYATIVIDNPAGQRVRNLVANTPFPRGQNTVYWDGLDDLGRDVEAARHGIYHIPGKLVAPGEYRVRGLMHRGIDLKYEFPIYTSGNPAWNTADNTGAWLANHSPPSATVFVPAERSHIGKDVVYIGSYVSEGTHGLAWVDLDGKKLGGMNWVGGNWTGAPFLAYDRGAKAVPGQYVFTGSVWPTAKGKTEVELRLNAITKEGVKEVLKHVWDVPGKGGKGEDVARHQIAGLAARDGLLAVSLRRNNQVIVVDVATKKIVGKLEITEPRGLAFDDSDRLLVLTATELHRHVLKRGTEVQLVREKSPPPLVKDLADAQHVTTDADGRIYISDVGNQHLVRVFEEQNGRLVAAREIGHRGVPHVGPYDPNQMHKPAGITIDKLQRLWVAEADEQPKRISVWSLKGKHEQDFLGPAEYGGGGRLDPKNSKMFYYHGMEFQLDWKLGKFRLDRIFFRPQDGDLGLPGGPHHVSGMPDTAIYLGESRYFTNCNSCNPTGGTALAMLWADGSPSKGLQPVAAIGSANVWPAVTGDKFADLWPKGLDRNGDRHKNAAVVVWNDLNGDGQVQPDEVTITAGSTGGITVMPDASFVLTRVNGECVQLSPDGKTPPGHPRYNWSARKTLATGVKPPASSGGDQALTDLSGWTCITLGMQPYHTHSICGVFQGQPRWSYPNLWPGLHASHESPQPEFPGEVIGVTRLLGNFVHGPVGVGPMFVVNSNMGPMHMFTADGLYVAQLFQDSRQGVPWKMPLATRDMRLNEVTTSDENFWPSVTQTSDGRVFLSDGGRMSLIRVDGLPLIARLPERTIKVTEQDLQAAVAYQAISEAARQQAKGLEVLPVILRQQPPKIDGQLTDWAGATFAPIDQRGVKAYFNSNSKPYDVQAAVCLAGDRFYAAFKTGDPKLLKNSGEQPQALFKTGGALDVMLGTNAAAPANRDQPVAGDLRLLITMVKDKPVAVIYRAVVPGTASGDRVPFSSPWRTIYFDRVETVTSELQFAAADGNFEFSLPLAKLGLRPEAGQTLKGDLGILRGDGTTTTARIYWANKATGITADVPSEAALTPKLWGTWRVEKE